MTKDLLHDFWMNVLLRAGPLAIPSGPGLRPRALSLLLDNFARVEPSLGPKAAPPRRPKDVAAVQRFVSIFHR